MTITESLQKSFPILTLLLLISILFFPQNQVKLVIIPIILALFFTIIYLIIKNK